ncbi:immunoglobulin domain-containing protein oig-4-like [Oratosquilla oratoria]|uniref:immunoglobulin domain-containing protein oig-4-like n=1 Tax=Oratosquilla oratoria TaxID=337810 RepID=UPI003F75EB71
MVRLHTSTSSSTGRGTTSTPLVSKKWLVVLMVVVLLLGEVAEARKGGGRRRKGGSKGSGSKSIFIPIDPASRAYYDNTNGAKITNWSHFESEYILGRKIVFMCSAEGHPRPNIMWFKNGIELYAHDFLQVHEWFEGEKIIKSKMEIDPATQMDAGYYECQANNKYAVDTKGFRTDYLIFFD